MKSTKNVTTMTCDGCGKEASDLGERRFGGSNFAGWYSVSRILGSTSIISLTTKEDLDFCCAECLVKFFKTRAKPQGPPNTDMYGNPI